MPNSRLILASSGFAAIFALAQCSSPSSGPTQTGSGGSKGSGSGGSNGSGGSTGSGGSNGSGGSTGSGGSGAGGSSTGAVTVQLGQTEQMIQGFGINDNWASQFSGPVADSLFSTSGTGIGLTILRTGMSPSGAFYNTGEVAGNIAAVKSASRAGANAKIIGSVWSPPAACKTNNSISDGGHLCASNSYQTALANNKCTASANSTCYDMWSTTIANFASSNGFYAMSIGNEPEFASCGTADPCNGNYDTTLFTANEMVTWTKMAGQKLRAAGVKVIAPEASEWLHVWSNVSAGPDVGGKESSDPLKCGCFPNTTTACASACSNGDGYDYGHYLAKDSTAWGLIDILGVHEYDSQVAMP